MLIEKGMKFKVAVLNNPLINFDQYEGWSCRRDYQCR